MKSLDNSQVNPDQSQDDSSQDPQDTQDTTPDSGADGNGQQDDSKATVSADDVEIAVRLGIKMLNEGGGLQIIQDAINKSQDPSQVIGQFLAQLMSKMAEQLQQKIGLDPAVFLAKKGFLETILDYIEHKLGYPSDFSDKVYHDVLEVIKAAAQQPPPPNDVNGGQALDSAPAPDATQPAEQAGPPSGPPSLDQGPPNGGAR